MMAFVAVGGELARLASRTQVADPDLERAALVRDIGHRRAVGRQARVKLEAGRGGEPHAVAVARRRRRRGAAGEGQVESQESGSSHRLGWYLSTSHALRTRCQGLRRPRQRFVDTFGYEFTALRVPGGDKSRPWAKRCK